MMVRMLSVVSLLLLLSLSVHAMNTTTTSTNTRRNASSGENLVTVEAERPAKRAKSGKSNAVEKAAAAKAIADEKAERAKAKADRQAEAAKAIADKKAERQAERAKAKADRQAEAAKANADEKAERAKAAQAAKANADGEKAERAAKKAQADREKADGEKAERAAKKKKTVHNKSDVGHDEEEAGEEARDQHLDYMDDLEGFCYDLYKQADLRVCACCGEEHGGHIIPDRTYGEDDPLFVLKTEPPERLELLLLPGEPLRLCTPCLQQLKKGRRPCWAIHFPEMDSRFTQLSKLEFQMCRPYVPMVQLRKLPGDDSQWATTGGSIGWVNDGHRTTRGQLLNGRWLRFNEVRRERKRTRIKVREINTQKRAVQVNTSRASWCSSRLLASPRYI